MLDWFKKEVIKEVSVEVIKYKIVEVEAPRQTSALDEERRKSVPTLAAHPGFLYLTNKLKLQRQLLETALKSTQHTDIRAVEKLQGGIFWSRWLDDQLNYETMRTEKPAPKDVLAEEEEALRQITRQIEEIR